MESWTEIFITYLILFTMIFLRYVMVSGIFYMIFYSWRKEDFKSRKISSMLRKPNQTRKEILNSFWSSGLFAIGGTYMIHLFHSGQTKVYIDPMEYGILYLVISGIVVLLIHETYYYWLHRLMHHPKLYRAVHKMHHDSIVTSPWTSFSFDPIETVLQAVFLPIVIIVMPLHFAVLAILLMIMTVSATINHLDIEIYPKGFNKHPIGRWFIGATHHSLHHSEFTTNYGLYFTFWDRWMSTESNQFNDEFEKATEPSSS